MSNTKEISWNSDAIKCYQCGKCSAGCQLSSFMDYLPHQVIRFIQLDEIERLLKSKSIWYCAGCQTCYSRCPQQVNLPMMMDHLCEESLKQKIIHSEAKKIVAFHQSFLHNVRHFGRSFEFGLVVELKLRTLNFFQDVMLAPAMIFKRKLSFTPAKVKQITNVEEIFKNS